MTARAVALLALAASLTVAAAEPAQTTAVVRYLADHAIPIKGVQAGIGFEDLKPLETVWRDVRIVGLGEATHGTREFFQFKHRMLEFLVTRMGFNVFAIEASYAACLNINDYVLYGKGTAAEALASQKFWTWDTVEVLEMIEWLREHNRKLPEARRVKFLGYDIQHYDQAFDVIAAYLKQVAPQYLPTAQDAFEPMRLGSPGAKEAFGKRNPDEINVQITRLQALLDFFELHRAAFIKQTSSEEFDKALQHARVLFQYHQAYSKPANGLPLGSRDQYMAQNIRHLIDALGPQTKMVVWAHNNHVADRQGGGELLLSMGHFLRQWYGRDYYILGFAFNEGSFQSMGPAEDGGRALQEFTLPPVPEGSLSWYLERARQDRGYPQYLVDFRAAPANGPFAEWLATPQPMISAGSRFARDWKPEQYIHPVAVGKEYDGMFFIGKTTRARTNR